MKRVIAILCASFLSACAASGSVQKLSASAPAVDSAASGAVEVSTALPDKADSAEALKRAIVAQLVTKKVFKNVSDLSSADYVLRVNVTEVNEVSQTGRILFGALAGQASIGAQVDIYDKRQGAVISTLAAKGTSSGGHAFAGTTQDAIDLTAAQIADYLLENRKL